jgi:hypothetical protein
MKHCEPLEVADHQASSMEMESTIRSLRELVCDLLKKNQLLRDALSEVKPDLPGAAEHV